MNKIRTTFINGIMTAALAAIFLSGGREAAAQSTTGIPQAILTPDKLETRLGTLEFKDGAPSKETVEKVYDNLDFMHATEAFVNAFQGASTSAIWNADAPELYKEASPITHVSKQSPPSLLLNGTIDQIVPFEQSQRLANKLGANNVPYIYVPFEGQFHAFDYFQDTTERSLYFIEKFLAEYL